MSGRRVWEWSRRRMLRTIGLGVAAVALFSTLVPLQTVYYGTPVMLAIPLGIGLAAAPLLALTHARTAIAVACLAAIALPLLASARLGPGWPWPWSVPAMIAMTLLIIVVTLMRGWRMGLLPWGVSMVGTLLVPLVSSVTVATTAVATNFVVAASLMATVLLVAGLVEDRIRVVTRLSRSEKRTEAEQSRRVRIEERARIARELHDMVAHSMSVIQVQASTARYRLDELSPEAIAEFDDIAATTRSSLVEMRRVLGVLRTDDQVPQLAPQQGIDDVPALVDSIRRAGAEVHLSLIEPPEPPSRSVQITAYRIIQEALSNAVRHAPGAPIRVEMVADETALHIRIRNEAPRPRPGPPSGGATDDASAAGEGHGLAGMRERVAILAGNLSAGPDPAGGWTVTAMLPLAEVRERI